MFLCYFSNADKFKVINNFKAILKLASVKEKLIDVISVDMIDFFTDMSRPFREEIVQYFANHGQRSGAEYFLDRIEGMGTSWPRHLMQALEAHKHFDYMQYLYEEYQEHLRKSKRQTVPERDQNSVKGMKNSERPLFTNTPNLLYLFVYHYSFIHSFIPTLFP